MTITNPGPFSGSGQTSVTLAANNTGATRTGTIRISFGGNSFDITVTQTSAPSGGLTAQSCSLEATSRSIDGVTATQISFVNNSSQVRRIYWLNYTGQRVLFSTLQPGQTFLVDTYLTHPWISANSSDVCQAIYLPVSGLAQAFLQ